MFTRPKKTHSAFFECYNAPERAFASKEFLNPGHSAHDKISLRSRQKKKNISETSNSPQVSHRPIKFLQLRERALNAPANIHFSYKADDHYFNICVKKPSFEGPNQPNSAHASAFEEIELYCPTLSTAKLSPSISYDNNSLVASEIPTLKKRVRSTIYPSKDENQQTDRKIKINRFYSTAAHIQPAFKENESEDLKTKNQSLASSMKLKVSKNKLSQTMTENYVKKDKNIPTTPMTATNRTVSNQKLKELQKASLFFNQKGTAKQSIFCMKMRKTETVMTDKTSEVEHSILIDNYEGLLAKIHENRLLDDTDSQTSRF